MALELKGLLLRQVDESLKPWVDLLDEVPPGGGWIRSIRQALGMSAAQLGRRMGLTRQGVTDLERRESRGAVTLTALQKAAEAMNAVVVYAIVPRQSLAETIRAQARTIAEKQLKRVDHSMLLEGQDVSREEYANQLAEHQDRLLRNWSRHIWDEEDVSRKK